MNKAEQEAGGWIKHDGGDMPDCYESHDLIDVLDNHSVLSTEIPAILWSKHAWLNVRFYRKHISEREQIDMAIEALEVCQRREYNPFEPDNQSDLWKATEETLTKLKERRPN